MLIDFTRNKSHSFPLSFIVSLQRGEQRVVGAALLPAAYEIVGRGSLWIGDRNLNAVVGGLHEFMGQVRHERRERRGFHQFVEGETVALCEKFRVGHGFQVDRFPEAHITHEQHILAVHLREGEGFAPGEAVSSGEGKAQMFLAAALAAVRFTLRGEGQCDQLVGPVVQAAKQFIDLGDLGLNGHAGVDAAEFRGEKPYRCRRAAPQRNRPVSAVKFPRPAGEGSRARQHILCKLQHILSIFIECQTVFGPVKEGDLQLILQFLHAAAQGRLGEMQDFGRL